MKLDHLSASRIKTFESCPLKYRAIYELGFEDKPHPAAVMGSALHKGMELGVTALMKDSEAYVNFEELTRAACSSMGVQSSDVPTAVELTNVALAWGYLRNVPRCVGCEVPFNLEIPGGVMVKGYIDRLDLIKPDGAEVHDLKTQKQPFDESTLKQEWQAVTYNWAVRRLYPEITGTVIVSFWVLRHQVQRVWMGPEDARIGEQALVRVAEEIRACEKPEPKTSGLCTFCPYFGECTAAKQTIKQKFHRRMGHG